MLQASIFFETFVAIKVSLNIVSCNIISIEFVPDSSNLFPWFSFNLPLLLIISDKKFQLFFFCIIVWEIFRISRSSVQNCIGLNECVKMNQANQNECVRLLKMDGSSQSESSILTIASAEGAIDTNPLLPPPTSKLLKVSNHCISSNKLFIVILLSLLPPPPSIVKYFPFVCGVS